MTRANVVQQYLAVAIFAAAAAGLGLRSAFAHRRSHQTSWTSLALSPRPAARSRSETAGRQSRVPEAR
jgi:hypothetical protein